MASTNAAAPPATSGTRAPLPSVVEATGLPGSAACASSPVTGASADSEGVGVDAAGVGSSTAGFCGADFPVSAGVASELPPSSPESVCFAVGNTTSEHE